ANLPIVHRVLEPVGDGCVDLADVDSQIDQQSLPHLPLGVGDTDVREQRQPAHLDRHLRLGVPLLRVPLVYLVVLVGLVVHGATVAAATVSASWTGATS